MAFRKEVKLELEKSFAPKLSTSLIFIFNEMSNTPRFLLWTALITRAYFRSRKFACHDCWQGGFEGN